MENTVPIDDGTMPKRKGRSRVPLGFLSPNIKSARMMVQGSLATPKDVLKLRPMTVSRRTPGLGPARRIKTPPPGNTSNSASSSSASFSEQSTIGEDDEEEEEEIDDKLRGKDVDLFLEINEASQASDKNRCISRDLSDEFETGVETDDSIADAFRSSFRESEFGEIKDSDDSFWDAFGCRKLPSPVDCTENGLREVKEVNAEGENDDVLLGDVSICTENRELSDIVGKFDSSDKEIATKRFKDWTKRDLVEEIVKSRHTQQSLQSALLVMERAFERQGKTLESVRSEKIKTLRRDAKEAMQKIRTRDNCLVVDDATNKRTIDVAISNATTQYSKKSHDETSEDESRCEREGPKHVSRDAMFRLASEKESLERKYRILERKLSDATNHTESTHRQQHISSPSSDAIEMPRAANRDVVEEAPRWSRLFRESDKPESTIASSDAFPNVAVSNNESLETLYDKWRKLEVWYAGRIRKAMGEDVERRMTQWKSKYSCDHE